MDYTLTVNSSMPLNAAVESAKEFLEDSGETALLTDGPWPQDEKSYLAEYTIYDPCDNARIELVFIKFSDEVALDDLRWE